jgi:SAM-dependent methyltransferase
MPESRYVFDNASGQAEHRFGALEELFDENSQRQLAPRVFEGARCLEVGAGSGSMALWMAARVGETGHVLATDINPRFVEALTSERLEVRQHDITHDALEPESFDLVHTRLVLVHLPEREAVVERMIAALKPGGWLVLEEFESLSMSADAAVFPDEHLFKTLSAMWRSMAARGVDVQFGRKLFPLFRRLGLEEVSADGMAKAFTGASAGARLMRANWLQSKEAILATGSVSEDEFAADLARLDDPNVLWPSSVMWTVKGRKPA